MLDRVVDKVQSYLPATNVGPIIAAYEFAAEAHDGQRRRSGEPYIVHPLGVASTIAELRLDVPSVCAGLLHDCIEDTHVTAESIRDLFGGDVLFLVDGVTKLSNIRLHTREERQAENFRKMVLAMAKDIRVVLIKLADRLDNMRTLEHMSSDKQERIARETKEIYAPIANRLGIQWMKTELDDLCFRYLFPEEFNVLAEQIQRLEQGRRKFVEEVAGTIRDDMRGAGVECQVIGRPKHFWSIFQKLKRQGRALTDVDQLYDIMAFRVVTDSTDQCYQALGRLHSRFKPIPGRFKDHIALPKANGYQSLHTSVIGPESRRIEIQIRTQEMHHTAEYGIAAHWKYKEGKPLSIRDENRYAWLRQLMDTQSLLKDPTDFIETVKLDLFDDEVYVFTPQGDVKSFPKGATPVDFAFSIHSEVGTHCSGARVNGAMVPLKYQLQSGDTIEVLTNNHQHPTKDWLKFVVTGRAKSKIRHYIRSEQRTRSKELGRDLLERELRKYRMSLAKLTKSGRLEDVAPQFRLGKADEVLINIGFGKLMAADVAQSLRPESERGTPEPEEQGVVERFLEKVGVRRPSKSGITVQGLDDMMVRFARCCNPVRGDVVIGFITRGRGITIHTRECPKALDLDPERRIEVSWDAKYKTLHPVSVRVESTNRRGLLAEVSKAFSTKGVNILQAHCRTFENDHAVNTFQVQIEDLAQLKKLIREIARIDGVLNVERLASW